MLLPITKQRAGMASASMAVAAIAALGVLSWQPFGSPLGFAPLPPTVGPSAGARVVGARSGVAVAAEGSSASSASAAAPLAALATLAAVGLAGRALQRRSQSRVVMSARGHKYLRPNTKGRKPMIHRPLARDMIKDNIEGWTKKYKKAGDFEEMMKKTLYGRVQFHFSSKHFTDDIPWFPRGGRMGGGMGREKDGHMYDNQFYVRKFLEPAKFKKLEIANWEMPENYSKSVTLQELVAAGMQYGHHTNGWNPKMLKYMYAEIDGNHIFDLVQTAAMMNRACYYVMEAASKGANFLFTGTKETAAPLVVQAAKRVGAFYVEDRFVGGIMTNFEMVRQAVDLMIRMRGLKEQGAWKSDSENVKVKNASKLNRLTRKYAGVEDLHSIPDILIVVDEVKERNAIAEANRVGVPVIALIDSNANPDHVDLPIPGNAAGSKSIELFLDKISEAILRGQALAATTAPGDQHVFEKEYDPWMFSKDRMRAYRYKSKRQPWMKVLYGGYEKWKVAHPMGKIWPVAPFDPNFQWE